MNEDVSLLHEIDDALRADRLYHFWQRYGKVVLAGCAGVVALVATSVFWKNHLNDIHIEQTHVLLQADSAAQDGRFADAVALLAAQKEWTPELEALANLRGAALHISMNKPKEASSTLKAAAGAEVDAALRDSALVRLRSVETTTDLSQASGAGRPFATLANELQATTLLREGKNKDAAALLTPLLAERQPSSAESERTQSLLRLTGEGTTP